MAVAEAKKLDKVESAATTASGPPQWLGWGPKKLQELKTFFIEVRTELKKVTWPGRNEVQATTIVVVVTTVFFGFYLYGMDLAFSWILSFILK
jgi:preprotein translocase subunit SecE